MSDEVEVEFDENPQDQAVLLLAAAEELDQDPSVVRTTGSGFLVPEDVAKKANSAAFKKKQKAAGSESSDSEGSESKEG